MKWKVYESYYKSTESLLYNYNMLKLSILSMTEALNEIEKNNGLAGTSYDGIQTAETFKINKMVEGLAITNVCQEQELKQRITRIKKTINRIDRAIEQLPDLESKIIQERYFKNHPWYNIAFKMKISERHSKRVRSNAINKIAVSLYGDIAIFELKEIQ